MQRMLGCSGNWLLVLAILVWPVAGDAAIGNQNPINVADGDSATAVYNSGTGLTTVTQPITPGSSSVLVDDGALVSNGGLAQDAVHTAGGGYTIDIYGTVQGYLGFDAVEAAGDNNIINHYGDTTIETYGAGAGIRSGDGAIVTNDGLINSQGDGIVVGNDSTVTNNDRIWSYATGVAAGDRSTIVNNGEIQADIQGLEPAMAALVLDCGIAVGNGSTVTNNGLIDSATANGITAGDGNTVINNADGVINAADENPGNGIDAQDNNIITNHGTINALYNAAMWETGLPGHSHGIHAVSGNDISNDGIIVAGTAGIEVTGDDNDILNADGGVIYAYQVGIAAGNPADALNQEIGNRVTNEGQIGAAPTLDGDNPYDGPVPTGITVANQATVVNGCANGNCTGTIHADYVGISTSGLGDSITNYGTIYVYGGGLPDIMLGEQTPSSNAGISVGPGLRMASMPVEEDLTPGIGDLDLDAEIVNTITNHGTIDAYYEFAETGAAGIQAFDHNRITNKGVIDALYDGIRAGSYNIIDNSGEITSDRVLTNCGIDAESYNLIYNSGAITSINSDGIRAWSHNEITNSGAIDAYGVGIAVGPYSIVNNEAGGEISGATGITMDGPGVINIYGGRVEGFGNIEEARVLQEESEAYGTAILTDAYNSQPTFVEGPSLLGVEVSSDQIVNITTGAEILGNIDDHGGYDQDELNFTGSGIGRFDYNSRGFEIIRKTGTGTWVLGETSRVGWAWTANIEEGILQVDGALGADDVFVRAGGTLAGNGTVDTMSDDPETVHNAGTIAPGSAVAVGWERIGTLTIDNTFENYLCGESDCDSGNLEIELYASGDAAPVEDEIFEQQFIEETPQLNDELRVWGDRTAIFGGIEGDAGGGTVTALPLNYLPEGRYTFLVADHLEVNEVPTVIDNSALLNFSLGYDDAGDIYDTMWLDVTRNSIADVGGNGNDRTMFEVINEIAGDDGEEWDDFDEMLAAIVQSGDPITLLGLLSPEQYPALLDAGMANAGLYRSGLLSRIGNLHLTHGSRERLYAGDSNALLNGQPALARLSAESRTPGGWSGWARVLGMTGDQDGDNGIKGFDIDSYGLALGFDNKLSDNLVLGIGAGYTESDVNFDDSSQDSDVDSYHAALYGSYSTSAFYLDGAMFYADSDYDSDRLTPGDKATSSTDGDQWGLYLGAGYNLVDDASWYFIPTASAQWAEIDIDGFTEKGAGPFNLEVESFDTDSLVTTLGFRVGANLAMGEMELEPELRLSWAHEFGDTDRDVTSRFVMSGPSFSIKGVEPEEDSALVGAGINAHVNANVTIFVDYDGEFRDDFDSHLLSGGLRCNF